MPADVIDQIAALGQIYAELAPPISATEVERGDPSIHLDLVEHSAVVGVRHRDRHRPWWLVAAAALVVVGSGAVLLAVRRTDTVAPSDGSAPAVASSSSVAETDPSSTEPPTVPAITVADLSSIGADSWAVAEFVPDGLEFVAAFDDGPFSRSYSYASSDNIHGFSVRVSSADPTPLETSDTTEIDGDVWQVLSVTPTSTAEPSDLLSLQRIVGGVAVSVTTIGYDRATAIEIAASLHPSDASVFPRPPLDMHDDGSYTDVATATSPDGSTVTLRMTSDGRFYCFSVGSSGGCIAPLPDGAAIGGLSSDSRPDDAGAVATHVVYGIVRADVATVRIHFADGEFVDTTPQDTHDAFADNFFLVDVPAIAGVDVAGQIDHVSALGADGTELDTTDFSQP